MIDLFDSIFYTHLPTWADIQSLLGMMLTSRVRCMVAGKIRAVAQSLHDAGPHGDHPNDAPHPTPMMLFPWDPNMDECSLRLNSYPKCLNKIQELQQGIDPLSLLKTY